MRAGRLFALVSILERRGQRTASELAEELEVSVRTVLRDIEALSGAGVRVYSTRGASGGFTLESAPNATAVPGPQLQRRRTVARARVLLSPAGQRGAALFGPRGFRLVAGANGDPNRPTWVVASVRVDDRELAVRELLALGPEVEVLEPDDLRNEVAAAAAAMARLYADR